MKNKIKRYLQNKGIYYPIRYSPAFRLYQVLFKRGVLKQEKNEISFYRSFLNRCHLIFDIGAFDGHKTEAFLKIADKVISCEPDQFNYTVLKARFGHKKNVALENKAVADMPGERRFLIHHPGSAFNTLSQKWKQTLEEDQLEKWDEKIKFTGEYTVPVTTLDLLIEKYGKPDFIKIDVEGYEQNVLKSLSVPVPFISFEALWPGGKDEIQNCFDRLQTIEPGTIYNIAVFEKLLLAGFQTREQIMVRLSENDITHLEIIAKMNP